MYNFKKEELEEWFYAAEHGTVGVGWKFGNKLITSLGEMHKLLETIMDRPVWSSEMAKSNQDNLRKELETGEKGFSFYTQMNQFKEQGKLIVVVHDEKGEDISELKKTILEREKAKK